MPLGRLPPIGPPIPLGPIMMAIVVFGLLLGLLLLLLLLLLLDEDDDFFGAFLLLAIEASFCRSARVMTAAVDPPS